MRINTSALKYFFYLFIPKYSLPTYCIESINQINTDNLISEGKKGIIFDIDQTLSLPGNFEIYHFYLNTFSKLSKNFKVCALTNQGLSLPKEISKQRIKNFRVKYGLKLLSPKIKKPDPSSFNYAIKYLKLKHNEVIFIGDRILTDIIGANLVNIDSILVNSIDVNAEPFFIRIIIKIERTVLKLLLLKYRDKNGIAKNCK